MLVHHLPNPPPRSRYYEIARFLHDHGAPPYRIRQIVHAVVYRGVHDFDRMAELPRPLRDSLAATFGPRFTTLQATAEQHSDHVHKTLLTSPRGGQIESVFLDYPGGWSSLCLSSQVGCGLGCTFCATGALGLTRNLTADEIIDQVLLAERRPDSVAFMGMGEPLANPHTLDALELLTDPGYLGFSPRRLTVSTVGFLPGMHHLVERHPRVVLTLSVHSPFDDERRELIPLNDRFPVADCLHVLDRHVARTHRRAYLAYLLIDGVNDSAGHARALARLVNSCTRPDLFMLSVIPFNTAEGLPVEFRPPRPSVVRRFLTELRHHGIHAVRRNQFGGDIDAACGQLAARDLQG